MLIYTLGPHRTDAHWLASRLSPEVRLVATFRAAMTNAEREHALALVACGCLSPTESWVDLHFEFLGRLAIQRCFEAATQPMCLARNQRVAAAETVATYRALGAIVSKLVPNADPLWCQNKVEAVTKCREGAASMCIGTLSVVEECPELEVVHVFRPSMIWCLYGAVSAPATIHQNVDSFAGKGIEALAG